jgi:hypothetical protein
VAGRLGREQDDQGGQHGGQVLGSEQGRAGDRLEEQVGDGAVAQLGPKGGGREGEGDHRQQHGQDQLAEQLQGEGG